MNFSNINEIRREGFDGFVSIRDLQMSKCRAVPDSRGIYVVLRPDTSERVFLPDGTGGYFKGKNPNREACYLTDRWVDGSVVLYIGKAGGPGKNATLRTRLNQYVAFGQRKRVGHWGGRYIWQLRDSCDLLVCWKVTLDSVPRDLEKTLLLEFKNMYRRFPFANLCR